MDSSNKEKMEKAKLELQEARKVAAEDFMKEYEELCKKHGFRVLPQVSIVVAPLED